MNETKKHPGGRYKPVVIGFFVLVFLGLVMALIGGNINQSNVTNTDSTRAVAPNPTAPPDTDQAPTTAPNNEALIDAQIAAYNARDLEKFLGYYSDDVVLIDYPDQVTQSGKEAMRASYKKNFEDPDIRAAMKKRIVFGKFIVDHEQLTRAPAPGMIESVVIYEIKGGKIVRVTFLNQ